MPRSLDPRIVTVWRVQGAVVPLVLAVAVLVAGLRVDALPGPTGLIPAVILVVGGALALVVPALAYRHWRYTIADTTLELRHGVVVRTESSIPYFRVQHIDVTAGPVDRLCGVARLVVRTASASTDATIPGIAAGDADALRQLILERVGTGDAV
ncbi:PH domain-containing protein [soil metagenome]